MTDPESAEALDPNAILIEEFKYIAQSAFQNSEDRAKVSSFYLVTVGSFVVAILGARIEGVDPRLMNAGLGVLFLLLSIVGLFTLIQLVQLRRAWLDAVRAMNAIKQHYIDADQTIAPAIRWTQVPPGFKLASVSSMLALQIGVIGALTLGASLYFLEQVDGVGNLTHSALAGGIYFVVILAIYVWRLRQPDR